MANFKCIECGVPLVPSLDSSHTTNPRTMMWKQYRLCVFCWKTAKDDTGKLKYSQDYKENPTLRRFWNIRN